MEGPLKTTETTQTEGYIFAGQCERCGLVYNTEKDRECPKCILTPQAAALKILLYVAECQRIDATPRMEKVVAIINSVHHRNN